MHSGTMMTPHIQQLIEYTKYLERRIVDLENQQVSLAQEIQQLKNQTNQNKIDRVEYKFDQLKIERLEGTLNIGLAPFQGENQGIEDFSVNQEQLNIGYSGQNGYQLCCDNIKRQINSFLTTECESVILSLEQKYRYNLDETYRKFIIYDVQKQIDKRIEHYLKTFDTKQLNHDQSYQHQAERDVTEKVKVDIHKTLELFVQNLPKEVGR